MLRKIFALPVAGLLLLSGCRSGNAELEKQNAEILAEMKKLNARLDAVEQQAKQNSEIRPELKKLNARLERLENWEKKIRVQTRQALSRFNRSNQTGPQLRGINVRPDMTKLSQIRLSANPTDQQIIEYIRQIRDATEGQNIWSDEDPQIEMYEKIGPGHLRLLLPYLRGGGRYRHLYAALPKLIDDRDKEQVRKLLADYPVLLQAVVRKGWLKEMKYEVFRLLKARKTVALHVIKDALPDLAQSPEELEILKDVYIHQVMGYVLLDSLKKKLPEPEIREMVNQAWAAALKKQLSGYPMTMRAQHAVQEGQNVEALKFLLKMIMSAFRQGGQGVYLSRQAVTFLSTRCDFPVYDPARLREWYDKNADRIAYDPATGKYVVKK